MKWMDEIGNIKRRDRGRTRSKINTETEKWFITYKSNRMIENIKLAAVHVLRG